MSYIFNNKILLKIYKNNFFKTYCRVTEKLKLYGLHSPGENHKDENYIVTENTQKHLQNHLKITGGKVRTRFPPDPNGLLHIGHAKAININFGLASTTNGVCILRYDDTNPETENDIFSKEIENSISWMGFQPSEITFASNYFSQLHEWAKVLIKKNLAYVCHEPPSSYLDANKARPSPWRNRSKEESLELFEKMKLGGYKEREATLRLKMTTDQNIVDPVAYRIKYTPHKRTERDWCIYPTYDYAHCLCDSIENITHSLCTVEFELRRSTYYWICNALDIYCPVQTEYGRLNILNTVVSKRKIRQLIQRGHVKGWDDPRLYTLSGLKRRGVPSEVLNEFCSEFGLKRTSSYIDPIHLDQLLRRYLLLQSKKVMAVLNPLKIEIVNYPFETVHHLKVPNIGKSDKDGYHMIPFDKIIWIEKSDFREIAEKDFRRLTSKQGVGLKYSNFTIQLKEIVRNSKGEIDQLLVTCHRKEEVQKSRAFIHWVSRPLKAVFRIYDTLFFHDRPDEVPEGFLSDINPNSLQIIEGFVEETLQNCQPYDRFQFERIGFFSVDPDSEDNKLVFNKIVSIRQ